MSTQTLFSDPVAKRNWKAEAATRYREYLNWFTNLEPGRVNRLILSIVLEAALE